MSDANIVKEETLALKEASYQVQNISLLNAFINYHKKAFKFKDKANRKEYLIGMIFQWVMSFVFVGLIGFGLSFIGDEATRGQVLAFDVLQWFFWLVAFLPSFALTFRRSYSATGKAKLAVLYYLSFVIAMILYTVVITLAAFSVQYIPYFYTTLIFAFLFLMVGLVSFGTLLFKKAKV